MYLFPRESCWYLKFQVTIITSKKLFEGNLPILINLQIENFTKSMLRIENMEGHQ